jgi:hypothetical protein
MWALNLSDFEGIDYFTSLSRPLSILILFCKVQQYEGAFFLPDALAFFLSIIIVYSESENIIGLFCENCKVYYQSKDLYFDEGELFLSELQQATPGKYHFIHRYNIDIADKVFDKKVTEENPYVFISLKLDICPKCQKDSVISVCKFTKYYERNDDKLELKIKSEPPILDHIYTDKETADIIEEKYKQFLGKFGKTK